MSNELWIQKDGSTIAVKDMSDSHIANTIKMLQRNITTLGQEIVMHDEIHEHMTVDDLATKRRWELQIELFERELGHRKK